MGLDLVHFFPAHKATTPDAMEYFTLEELSECEGYIGRHSHFLVEIEDSGKSEVLYFIEKGSQRKGMNSKFYKDFQNNKPYFDIATVQKAYQYLQADHINTLERLQQNFQTNFIDNFVEGESIFYASW